MRPRRDTGARRRDDGLRQIRSDGEISYPGVDLPTELRPETPADDPADDRRLAPALDAGVAIQSRLSRQQAAAARRRRAAAVAIVLGVVALIAAIVAWRYVSDLKAAATPLASGSASASSTATASDAIVQPMRVRAVSAAVASPTPIFAWYRGVRLHLPVPLTALTEVGFHQASYKYALPMRTELKDANLEKAAHDKSTHRNLAKQPTGPDAELIGYCLRMWRSGRSGRPNTAVDCGAKPGTKVLAPVNGVIVRIQPYLLYGKYPDYEVHIHPDGTTGLDVVMIHLTALSCSVGEHVDGGLTPIAHVRKLSDKFFDQLAEYTRGGGNHVHIQVNDANYPGYPGLQGAISPDATAAAASEGSKAGPGTEATSTNDVTAGE